MFDGIIQKITLAQFFWDTVYTGTKLHVFSAESHRTARNHDLLMLLWLKLKQEKLAWTIVMSAYSFSIVLCQSIAASRPVRLVPNSQQ